jgi:ligand-binding sensor domain-containing protein
VADGLPTIHIKDMCADSQGRLWIGFESKGLSVLENEVWTNYTTLDDGLADNFVFDVFEDTTNTLWFCTHQGLSNYNNISWNSFFTKNIFNSNRNSS